MSKDLTGYCPLGDDHMVDRSREQNSFPWLPGTPGHAWARCPGWSGFSSKESLWGPREPLHSTVPLAAHRTEFFCSCSLGGAALEAEDAPLGSGASRHISRRVSPRCHWRRQPRAAAPWVTCPSLHRLQCPR